MEREEKSTSSSEENGSGFGQNLVNQLAREFLHEQRRSRRWGIFFKALLAFYLFAFLIIYLVNQWQIEGGGLGADKHTALIDIEGVIAANAEASADNVVTGLRAAFKHRKTKGVIIRINSPGGSPVQAGYVNDEIGRLRAKYPDIPVYAVISDICASGGYYIAAAADRIYADKASIVGSIGVIMAGFGFVEAIDKLGIERRLRHAGEHKGFLDPFSPENPEDAAHADLLLQDIYKQFIEVVKKGRGARLKEDPKMFSGLVWTGEQSVELGLVDGLGSASYVAREVVGADEIVDFTYRENYLDRFARRIGNALAERVLSLATLQLR